MTRTDLPTLRRTPPVEVVRAARRAPATPYQPHIKGRLALDRMEVPLENISQIRALQPRDQLDQTHIANIASAISAPNAKQRAPIEPVDLYLVGDGDTSELVLADGWHRMRAHERKGLPTIMARVYVGTLDDARAHATWANRGDKLGLTQEEKTAALLRLLRSAHYYRLSSRKLADITGLSHATCARYKRGAEEPEGASSDIVLVERAGQVYEMDVRALRETTPPTEDANEIPGILTNPAPAPQREAAGTSSSTPPASGAPVQIGQLDLTASPPSARVEEVTPGNEINWQPPTPEVGAKHSDTVWPSRTVWVGAPTQTSWRKLCDDLGPHRVMITPGIWGAAHADLVASASRARVLLVGACRVAQGGQVVLVWSQRARELPTTAPTLRALMVAIDRGDSQIARTPQSDRL